MKLKNGPVMGDDVLCGRVVLEAETTAEVQL